MPKKVKRKPRVIWALEKTDCFLHQDNGLVIGLCFPTKQQAKKHQLWAKGNIVKFVECLTE